MNSQTDTLISLLRPYKFPGKRRLLRLFTRLDREVSANIFGYSMRLDLQDWIQSGIYLGTFESKETSILQKYLRPGMTFLDVGANVGYFSALAASLVGPRGRVIAMEPSPYAFDRLSTWVGANGVKQVEPHSLALASTAGTLRLYVPPPELHNHTPSLIPSPEGTPVEVPVVVLDQWLTEKHIERIDLLKIDIEGYELSALQGSSAFLRNGNIRAILCEFNDYWLRKAGTSPQALFEFILSNGFILKSSRKPRFDAGGVENLFFVRTAG